MKRRIKGLFTLIFTLSALMLTALWLSTGASAAEKPDYTITYAKDGSVNIEATPKEKRNYITYTIDGTKPTYKSELFPESLNLKEGVTLRLFEFNIDNEFLWGIKLSIKPRVAPVEAILSEKDGKAEVKLYSETLGAKIYYTTDGSDPSKEGKLYLGAFTAEENTRIRAIAKKSGYSNSLKLNKYVYLDEINEVNSQAEEPEEEELPEKDETDEEEEEKEEATKKPVTSVPKDKDEQTLKAVSYTISRMADTGYAYITLTPRTKGNKIYYTTDGSKPTTDSKQYKTARVKFTEPGVLRCLEYNSKGEKVAALNIKVKTRCAEVTMTSKAITARTNTIVMSSKTPGAKIYYTIDETIPDEENGILYTGPITMGFNVEIRAIAFCDGYEPSRMLDLYTQEVEYKYVNEYPDDPIYKQMADLINSYRRGKGLSELNFDEKLTEAANIRAFELSILDSSKRPGGGTHVSAIKSVGMSVGRTAEFRSIYTKDLVSTIKEMIGTDSDGMFSEKCFDVIGAGHYVGKGGNHYWVILLADT